jgi:two-component system sensor histidine kinase CreC
LLDEDMPLKERHRFLESIRTEADRSERLINRLLHLAALEGKTELPKPVDIDLTEVITEACERSRTQAELARVTLELDLPQEPLTVAGDFYILRAALENLIENALQFSPRGSAVAISLCREGRQAITTIADEGPGLPDYALEKAFERFFSHRPENSSSKGSGLGLPFVKEAAVLHRGSATLSNRKPTGAIATLRLPLLS